MAPREDSSKLYNLEGPSMSLGCNLELKVVAVVDFPNGKGTQRRTTPTLDSRVKRRHAVQTRLRRQP
jgi:hypothetical protein